MKIKVHYLGIMLLLITITSALFISGCAQNNKNTEAFLTYVYSFDQQSNVDFFEKFNSTDGVEEISKLLDEKYEYMDNICTQNCIDRLRSNRDPISLWKSLNDKCLDMKINDINIKKINDFSCDFSANIDILRDDETVYSSVQKGQLTLDENNKIDNVYFQNLKKLFEIE